MERRLSTGRAAKTASVKMQREQANKMMQAIANVPVVATIPRDAPTPEGLSSGAADYWRLFVGSSPEGLLLAVDEPTLRQYCVVLARLDVLLRRIEEEGEIDVSPNGTIRLNPYYTALTKLTSVATNYATRLRLQPSMRNVSAEEKASRASEDGAGPDAPKSARLHLLFNGGRALPASPGAEDDDDD